MKEKNFGGYEGEGAGVMLVVDTSVIFALFLSSSFTRELAVKLVEKGMKLISPVHALNEISKYRNEIMSKFLLDKEEFKECLQFITLLIEFVEEKAIMRYLKDAQKNLSRSKGCALFRPCPEILLSDLE